MAKTFSAPTAAATVSEGVTPLVPFAAMSGEPKVLVERRGAITVVTLNRPDVHNCVDGETALAIGGTVKAFAGDEQARVLVVTGAGDVSFCSGADLRHTDELWTHELFEDRKSTRLNSSHRTNSY